MNGARYRRISTVAIILTYIFFNLWGDEEYDNGSVCGIVCEACDWPAFRKNYIKVSSGLKNKVKFLSKNSDDM